MVPSKISLTANGFKFHCLTAGEGPLVLCLHGFPDYPGTFEGAMDSLAAAGFRVVAPYLRGYHPDTLSTENSYQTVALAEDALHLIDALGYDAASIYGHDWGAAIAAAAAVLGPEKVTALVTSAVPYGSQLFTAIATDPEQQRRSWYMFFFQTAFAEMAVAANELAFIRRLWQDWSPGWDFSEADIQGALATLAQPGVLAAAITYYRCTLDSNYQKPQYAANLARIGEPIAAPTLHLHGGNDGCIGVDTTRGMAQYFGSHFELEVFNHCGHFLHLEDPSRVNARLAEFLTAHGR